MFRPTTPIQLRGTILSFTLVMVLSAFFASLCCGYAAESNGPGIVPQGEVRGPFEWQSKIYPGTTRKYWVYVPQQYQEDSPACVMIVQDGLGRAKGWGLISAWDRLIAEKKIPVQIGIMIEPGVVPAPHSDAQPRFNRSFEYDGLGDRYARFLIEEILPEVEKDLSLSQDPNDRALAGASSGGIAAFTAAWERPDAFRRVLSTIGTYVGLRGGNEYPILIRKTEPIPIRVFLQDGRNDLDIYGGDWWIANQQMLSALEYSGYDVKHVWGDGGHDSKQAKEVIDEALVWLWRDHPAPITVGPGKKRRTDLLIPGEDWELVSEGHRFTEGPAVHPNGDVFFADIPSAKIFRIDSRGNVKEFVAESRGANGMMFGPDGELFACESQTGSIVRYNDAGERTVVVEDANANDLILLPEGGYYSSPDEHQLWHFDYEGNKTLVDEGLQFPNGLITSPDQTRLWVADTQDRFVYDFQIQPDGTLMHKQKYGHLHLTDDQRDSGADGMTVDSEGRVYVATRAGLQVMDQLGRVHFIFRKPSNDWLSNVVLGGAQRDVLYVTTENAVYRRKINASGVDTAAAAIKPPRPGL